MKSKKTVSLLLVLAVLLASCTKSKTESEQGAVSKTSKLTPAYSVEGFKTVDADGSRITTGRDATGKSAMAAASKYEVSQVGAEIMKKGGNAIDAAVAMGFALGVCEPFTNGLGGGGLATIHTANGENIFIDFREIAPKGVNLEIYLDENGKSNGKIREGGLSSAIPGEVAGMLYMLENYGTMSRAEVMAPAIKMAEEGFVVSTYAANAIADAYEKATKYPEMQKVYWNEAKLPFSAGDVINNPDLAKTLKIISEKGLDGFYKGEVAEALIETLKKYEGVMTLEDLSDYKVSVAKPVIGDYRGYTIISTPPPSSGGTHLIEILNIIENFDVSKYEINSPEYIHLFTEAFKLSFADRAKYMADTNFTSVPLGGLTAQAYADERAKLITDKAIEEAVSGDPVLYEHTDTSHYSVADAQGNCVGVTKTINYYFGSGVMVDGYGFMMNNEMDDFSTNPASINKVEPNKKPLSSMSPTVVLDKNKKPFMILGTPGGARIFSGVAQVISRVIDNKLSLHDAISVPKIWNNGPKNNFQYEVPLKGYEKYKITEDTIKKLEEMGHGKASTAASGAVQAIMFMEDGSIYGTCDPRQDGKAAGF
ncbi:gamma-glutamyltransferase [Treponema phagedenis]|uniref:gamma-glutamyltransferase n=1 Tax=Treponema phagedenis TaxID=162 RepID=UPI0011F035CE|nr:gamma-glutamyltransferase [Treponema phagedenis]TYT79618.1 gamma-glutamyltransferase [Treponema phagedenis]